MKEYSTKSYLISTIVLIFIILRFISMKVYGTNKLSLDHIIKLVNFQNTKYEKSVDINSDDKLLEIKDRLEYSLNYLNDKKVLTEGEKTVKENLSTFKENLKNAKNDAEVNEILENLMDYFNILQNK